MGILNGPVFGLEQVLELLCPAIVGGTIVLAAISVWFAIGAALSAKR